MRRGVLVLYIGGGNIRREQPAQSSILVTGKENIPRRYSNDNINARRFDESTHLG
jgi:hypothetical protein